MLQKSCIFATSFKRNCKMKHRMVFVAFAALLALTGCRQNRPAGFDWDNNDRMEYLVDYTVSFAADHDSTMRLVATSNNGTAKVVPSGIREPDRRRWQVGKEHLYHS